MSDATYLIVLLAVCVKTLDVAVLLHKLHGYKWKGKPTWATAAVRPGRKVSSRLSYGPFAAPGILCRFKIGIHYYFFGINMRLLQYINAAV